MKNFFPVSIVALFASTLITAGSFAAEPTKTEDTASKIENPCVGPYAGGELATQTKVDLRYTKTSSEDLGKVIVAAVNANNGIKDKRLAAIQIEYTKLSMTSWVAYRAKVEESKLALPAAAELPLLMALEGADAKDVGRCAADIVKIETAIREMRNPSWYDTFCFWR